jgi:predicted RNA-binding protein with PUA-like domain
MNYWLVKSEPFKYSWDHFVAEKTAIWDGVRNYAARNNLKAMEVGDLVLFYHSNEGKEVVGMAKITKEHYPDPTTDDARWVVVELQPVEKFPKTVTLEQIKKDERLQHIPLVTQSRLSVQPIGKAEFDIIVGLGHV